MRKNRGTNREEKGTQERRRCTQYGGGAHREDCTKERRQGRKREEGEIHREQEGHTREEARHTEKMTETKQKDDKERKDAENLPVTKHDWHQIWGQTNRTWQKTEKNG
jgi:hypothetical protein